MTKIFFSTFVLLVATFALIWQYETLIIPQQYNVSCEIPSPHTSTIYKKYKGTLARYEECLIYNDSDKHCMHLKIRYKTLKEHLMNVINICRLQCLPRYYLINISSDTNSPVINCKNTYNQYSHRYRIDKSMIGIECTSINDLNHMQRMHMSGVCVKA